MPINTHKMPIKHLKVEQLAGREAKVTLFYAGAVQADDPITFITNSSLRRFMWMIKQTWPECTANRPWPT